jgi:ABC-type spermidine/putrescine transport system permease subunit I
MITGLCVVLGYPSRMPSPGRRRGSALGLFLLIMPLMVSTVIRVFGWVVILGARGSSTRRCASWGG